MDTCPILKLANRPGQPELPWLGGGSVVYWALPKCVLSQREEAGPDCRRQVCPHPQVICEPHQQGPQVSLTFLHLRGKGEVLLHLLYLVHDGYFNPAEDKGSSC